MEHSEADPQSVPASDGGASYELQPDDMDESESEQFAISKVLNAIPEAVQLVVSRCEDLDLPQVLVNLKVAVSETNVVTSVFSGTGGFECSVKWVLDSIHNIVCKSSAGVPLLCYSATEIAHHAQKALMEHDITTRPLHIFPDIMDRLYDTDKQRIMSIKQRLISSSLGRPRASLMRTTSITRRGGCRSPSYARCFLLLAKWSSKRCVIALFMIVVAT
jgi:hypothetical protein